MIDEKIFPFLAEKGHVISLVGGGGKTTLMYNLAAHCARKGWRVLAATTTHIMQPPGGVWAQTDAELFRLWKCGSYAVAGTAAHGGKLTAPPQAQLERWMTLADIVLIEADGAKRMPCKVPAAHEPVLLPESDIVLAVAGLSALGRPLREVCFRLEQACALLGAAPETLLTPEQIKELGFCEKPVPVQGLALVRDSLRDGTFLERFKLCDVVEDFGYHFEIIGYRHDRAEEDKRRPTVTVMTKELLPAHRMHSRSSA